MKHLRIKGDSPEINQLYPSKSTLVPLSGPAQMLI